MLSIAIGLALGFVPGAPTAPVPAPGGAPTFVPTPSLSGETLVIRGQRVFVRPGEVLEDAAVLVRNGHILAVGTDVVAPEGARELQGAVVCAGWIDAWSAFGLEDTVIQDGAVDAATRAVDGIDPYMNRRLKLETLGSGVTAVRVQAGARQRLSGVGAFVRNHPDLDPDEAVVEADCCVAASIGITRGSRGQDVFDRLSELDRLVGALKDAESYGQSKIDYAFELEEWQKAIAEKEAELEKGFKKAKKDREKDEKAAEEKGKEYKPKKYKEDRRPKEPKYDAEKEVLARVMNGELPLVVEVHGAAELRGLLDATEEFSSLRLVLAGATEAMSQAERLAERGIPVIVWPAPQGDMLEGGGEVPAEMRGMDPGLAAGLEAAGVEVLLGSGGERPDATRDLPLLAALAVGHGLDDEAALAAMTTRPAAVLDVGDRLGSLERGKLADLLVLDGDPTASTTRVRYVITGGDVVVDNQE